MKTPASSSSSLYERLTHWLQARKDEKQLIDYVIKTVEPKIKNARGYRTRLKQPIKICLEHCKKMVAEVPGPIHLKDSDYYSDPLIRAAFIGEEKIEDLLENLNDTLTPEVSAGQVVFALLTMTHKETTEFGSKQEGNMIIADANLRSVTFSDHKLVGLSTTLESSREKLETICFGMILEAISIDLAARRTDLADLRERRERLQAMSEMFSNGNHAGHYFGYVNPLDLEKLEKVEQLLRENEEELVQARAGVEEPEDWLEMLAEHLIIPEKMLNFQAITMRLDWRNVVTEAADTGANTIILAQCSLSEETVRDAVVLAYKVKLK
ncbi:MAG: hypothetical protein V2I36_07905 [Desulfopila sp.]|jgi:hypothetical protein|nr:hypothetical protein [Desulfopila sp.]